MSELLKQALEADNEEQLLHLCKRLEVNVIVTAAERNMSVAHHIATKPYGVGCLKVLVGQLGAACLMAKDAFNDTPIHLAALNENELMTETIYEALGPDCIEVKGRLQRTPVHNAAMNLYTNSVLKWLVKKCGPQCLTARDGNGDTPVHLAASFQDSDSMELIRKALEPFCAHQVGEFAGSAILQVAINRVRDQALTWLVENVGPRYITLKFEQFKDGAAIVLEAWIQAAPDIIQFIVDDIWSQIFFVRGFNDSTVTHRAAQNERTSSAFAWCVKNLSTASLFDRDSSGRTPVHLAAQYQDADTLRLIADYLEVDMFELTDNEGKTVAEYADCNRDRKRLLEWISEQRKLHLMQRCPEEQLVRQGPAQPKETLKEVSRVEPDLPASPPLLDPSFKSWSFIQTGTGKRQLIGEGGFGEVYSVFTDKHQTVAVKIVSVKSANKSLLEKAILSEEAGMNILKTLRHPNIIRFLKSERTPEGQFCIFTELISGLSIYELMIRRMKPFDEFGVRNFSLQICSALNYLHCQHQPSVLHRDIKCQNIMLSHEGVVKLIDFGLAKEIVTCAIGHNTKNACGTWWFMAPELFSSEDLVLYTPKSDVWAFGCAIFEMLTMEPPNGKLSDHQIPFAVVTRDMPDLPLNASANLRDFYRRCTVREPEKRADTVELLRHGFLQNN